LRRRVPGAVAAIAAGRSGDAGKYLIPNHSRNNSRQNCKGLLLNNKKLFFLTFRIENTVPGCILTVYLKNPDFWSQCNPKGSPTAWKIR